MTEQTNLRLGLSQTEAAASRERYGSNALLKEKTKGFVRKFLENLADPIIKVLLFSVGAEILFSLGRCNWFEIGGILLAVLIATTVSTASEYGSEAAFRRLSEASAGKTIRTLRDGRYLSLPIEEIVVGDVILLNAGETIPADGRVISGKITVDQSALNGESAEATKRESDADADGKDLSSPCHVFRGSDVTSGSALVRVERVGSATYFGMVAKDVQSETRESPLKLRLSHLARQISRIGYVMAGLVAVVYLFNAIVASNGYDPERMLAAIRDIPSLISMLSRALTLSITVIVVAVPEGLPMMITVVLSANMKRMMKDQIMVKKLVGIETAGSLNILFTDKTGTLTIGKTVCEKIVCVGREASFSGAEKLYERNLPIYRELAAAVFGTAGETGEGNATDRALLSFFGKPKETLPDFSERLLFTSERKFSAVRTADGRAYCKGAPEIILKQCSAYLSESGEKIAAEKEQIEKLFYEENRNGARAVAFATRDGGGEWVFLAFAILKDRVRGGVREEVSRINGAGVQVVMLTGDGKETAAAIAAECGILRSASDILLTRDEFARMSDDEVKEILPHLRVLSRALPQDKTRLVRLSQELDLVVGMTGDGVNDAPSLKLADVGFAMGSGTDVAKGASDIVILDNSFSAIGKTVLYGRTIFKSIRKFITFQLMMNLAACGVTLLGQFFGIATPITIVQMLWVNIIMDTLGGLAFAGEAPIGYYMKEKPKRRDEKILTAEMLRQIAITGGYTLLLCAAFLKIPFFSSLFRKTPGDLAFFTGFYALFIFSGIFNSFNTRSERLGLLHNIGKNKLFLLIMSLVALIQVLMIYFGGALFRCTPLTGRELLTVILLAASVIPFDFLRRVVAKFS